MSELSRVPVCRAVLAGRVRRCGVPGGLEQGSFLTGWLFCRAESVAFLSEQSLVPFCYLGKIFILLFFMAKNKSNDMLNMCSETAPHLIEGPCSKCRNGLFLHR